MKRDLDERIEDYLSGQLSDEETRLFESDLLKKEVATVFRETLMLRILLSNLPPDEPSPGLIDRLEASLNVASPDPVRKDKAKGISPFREAFGGLRWGLRWPGYVLNGMTSGPSRLKSSFAGMETIGYSLGPLNKPVRDRASSIRLPQKPLWKIALSKIIRGDLR
jgi:hypothetical protein